MKKSKGNPPEPDFVKAANALLHHLVNNEICDPGISIRVSGQEIEGVITLTVHTANKNAEIPLSWQDYPVLVKGPVDPPGGKEEDDYGLGGDWWK